MLTAVLTLALALQGTDTTVAVRPGTRLDLTSFEGGITVSTWSRAAVKVEADHDEDSGIEVDLSGSRLSLRGRSRYGPPEVKWRLTVPAEMALDLQTHSGDIEVIGTRGSVTAKSVEGDITIEGGSGFVTAQSVEGKISVSDASARVSLNALDGDVTASQIRGDLSVSAVDGQIDLADIDGASVEANTVDGNITFSGSVQRGGRYKLTSHDGNITFTTAAIDATVDVSTFSGDFESDWPVTLTGRTSSRQMNFTIGAGNARIELQSFDGNVSLRKAGGRRAQ